MGRTRGRNRFLGTPVGDPWTGPPGAVPLVGTWRKPPVEDPLQGPRGGAPERDLLERTTWSRITRGLSGENSL